jgi:hypothetical protein
MFYGRADARYCSRSCRQKAYRQRITRRAALETVAKPPLGDMTQQAQQIRERARTARENAAATRERAVAMREKQRG